MTYSVTNAMELGKAIKNGTYPIEVSDERLADAVKRIRKPSRIVWLSCLSAITFVAVCVMSPLLWTAGLITGPMIAGVAVVGGALPLAVLGLEAMTVAVNVYVHGDGKDALSVLREHEFVKGVDGKMILGA